MSAPEITNPTVAAYFEAAPEVARAGMMSLRARIFDMAQELNVEVTEDTKWGQPAYLTPEGSTIRLGLPKTGGFAIYALCGTTLISDFKDHVGADSRIEGNRAVLFNDQAEADAAPIESLIAAAFRYKRNR